MTNSIKKCQISWKSFPSEVLRAGKSPTQWLTVLLSQMLVSNASTSKLNIESLWSKMGNLFSKLRVFTVQLGVKIGAKLFA